jgi:hypothetical protein
MKVKYIASETIKANLDNGFKIIRQGDILYMTETQFEFFKPLGFEEILEEVKTQVEENSEEKKYKKSKKNRR